MEPETETKQTKTKSSKSTKSTKKSSKSDDKGEEFNRELVLEDFNIKNAPIITTIPNKINYDVDDDFLIDS